MLHHGPPLVALAAIAALLTAPLPAHVFTSIIGAGGGDNVAAVWNVWWARTALDGSSSLLTSPLIFAPFGANLAVHTLAPLVSVAAVLATPGAGPVATYNVALLGCVLLNLWTAYALAWAVTGDRMAAVFAGVAFAGAPTVLIRVYGHLNLAAAWVLPLVLLAVLRFEARPGWRTALVVSACLAAAAYTDYYYAIFGCLIVALHLALWRAPVSVTKRPLTPGRRRALAWLAATILVLAAMAGWIALTGGATTELAGERLSLTSTFNLRTAIGLLLLTGVFVWARPALRRTTVEGPSDAAIWRHLLLAVGLTILFVGPLLVAGFDIWLTGDYASQAYRWRSAPPGVDVATAALGNPLSWLTGEWTRAVYGRLGIDGVEGVAWLSLAPLALAVFAIRRGALAGPVRACVWIGGFFLVWSMGPYLQVLGWNTGVMLPETLVRIVPLVANARIPGRAFVVVALVVALVAAIGLASLRRERRGPLVLAAWAILAIDVWPLSHVLVEVPRPAIYDRLGAQPRGVVLEVPTGFRDGFGERGRLDHWTLAYQTQHGQPVIGGFVARLSPRVRDAYEADPVLRPLVDVSQGLPVTMGAGGCRDSVACPVRYVVLNRSTASPELVDLVNTTFALREIDRDAERTLFAVDGLRACVCSGPEER
jgi:hypothetical protein